VTSLWRLARRIHAAKRALAVGAHLSGARWNPRGLPVVYTGTSIALIALEYFVHISGDEPSDLVLLELQLPDVASRQSVALSELPDQWQDYIAVTQERGREWIDSNRSLALQVPSAIVPEESNVLLNPTHRGWRQVGVRIVRPFHFDRRMYKS